MGGVPKGLWPGGETLLARMKFAALLPTNIAYDLLLLENPALQTLVERNALNHDDAKMLLWGWIIGDLYDYERDKALFAESIEDSDWNTLRSYLERMGRSYLALQDLKKRFPTMPKTERAQCEKIEAGLTDYLVELGAEFGSPSARQVREGQLPVRYDGLEAYVAMVRSELVVDWYNIVWKQNGRWH